MTEEVWGPWIEHDGKGTPDSVLGRYVEMQGTRTEVSRWIREPYPGFDWSNFAKPIKGTRDLWDRIIRYRVRQFGSLEGLKQIAERPEKIGISETVR